VPDVAWTAEILDGLRHDLTEGGGAVTEPPARMNATALQHIEIDKHTAPDLARPWSAARASSAANVQGAIQLAQS
jgi:hypothetical protein